ncbi:unnamed protein product [Urochloa decumbens]|uniref:ArsA/GET3 Anion-transporting ATPase-like domain-containing protein n=1 Tax=Urochloa decumbens TaxID=240449 RepID=A0ABC9CWD1_9POAL
MESGGGKVPEDANDHCPGTESENAGKAEACAGCPNQQVCATAPKGPDPDLPAIIERMSNVKHKILVMSGKGGVGKSTFSTQLSFALAEMESNFGWQPVYVESPWCYTVMSIGFLLADQDNAVAWRGPRKNNLIKQFVKDVDWGDIDYLVVDTPPGTSDENISIVQYLKSAGIDGAIIMTAPQQVSPIDVRKGIIFCKMAGVPVLGVVENMSGLRQAISDMRFVKPSESGETDVTEWALDYIKEKAPDLLSVVACSEAFDSSKGGAEKMCHEMGVPFLGKVPMDPQLGKAVEEGRSCFTDQKCSVSAPALKQIIEKLIKPQ